MKGSLDAGLLSSSGIGFSDDPSGSTLFSHPSLASSSSLQQFAEGVSLPHLCEAYKALSLSASMDDSNGNLNALGHAADGLLSVSPEAVVGRRGRLLASCGGGIGSPTASHNYSFGQAKSLLPGSSVSLLEYAEEAVLLKRLSSELQHGATLAVPSVNLSSDDIILGDGNVEESRV